MPHLLVTNDFPPKVGGIQTYLHELWRRMPPGEVTVLTAAHPDAEAWDRAQPFAIERVATPVLVPSPMLVRHIDELAARIGASIVLLDPAFPLGAIGPQLERPYGVVLHGAEVTIPAKIPFVQLLLRRTLRSASLVVAAGGYPAAQGRFSAGRAVPTVVVPPGVDTQRFVPLDGDQRTAIRARYGLADDHVVVLGVSRLVHRKGFDVLVQAAALVGREVPELRVVIAGEGRDRGRLERLIEAMDAPVTLLGAVDDATLAELYGAADLFAAPCRDRWFGLEQEGFGIVFLEAAAAGLPAIAGASGGAAEAVVHGETGFVIEHPEVVDDVQDALALLVDDPARRRAMGGQARQRAQRDFDYDRLAATLVEAIRNAVPAPPVDTDGIDVHLTSLAPVEAAVGASADAGAGGGAGSLAGPATTITEPEGRAPVAPIPAIPAPTSAPASPPAPQPAPTPVAPIPAAPPPTPSNPNRVAPAPSAPVPAPVAPIPTATPPPAAAPPSAPPAAAPPAPSGAPSSVPPLAPPAAAPVPAPVAPIPAATPPPAPAPAPPPVTPAPPAAAPAAPPEPPSSVPPLEPPAATPTPPTPPGPPAGGFGGLAGPAPSPADPNRAPHPDGGAGRDDPPGRPAADETGPF